MAKVYLYKPGYNPYNFKDVLKTQLAEFTDEYMMAKVINAGHWHNTGYAQIQNEIPIPCDELLKKCDGKIYMDYETNGNQSGVCWTGMLFNNIEMKGSINLSRNIYSYDMPNTDTTIKFQAGHNSGSGAYIKCYSIYIEIPTLPSDKIKSSVKDAILNHKLIQHIALHESED